MTSATLATRSRDVDDDPSSAFAHVVGRLGCEGSETLIVGSPFDLARQMEVFIDATTPPPPARGKDSRYTRELVCRILDHIAATEGGAFVLFTSFALLHAVADELEEPLKALGYPLLVQGRSGARTQILERFRQNEHCVLLGAASFWQGVDVRGSTLRNVIITRLPFEPPDRPIVEARLERIQATGGDPFMDETLPKAILRFKQGIGRLIRSAEDRGRVVVLDPRIVTTRYGRAFLAVLPEGCEPTLIKHENLD